uniref:Uncharacterized protein n=1 Tax=Anguilla anguilla TaxID=7936 RepID=A0A0E9WSZ7_ANGAN
MSAYLHMSDENKPRMGNGAPTEVRLVPWPWLEAGLAICFLNLCVGYRVRGDETSAGALLELKS